MIDKNSGESTQEWSFENDVYLLIASYPLISAFLFILWIGLLQTITFIYIKKLPVV
jgi:hypothetical protein